MSQRVLCLFREISNRVLLTITRWLLTSTIGRSELGKPRHSEGRNQFGSPHGLSCPRA